MALQEFQEKYPTREDREEAVKSLSDQEIDKMIVGAGIVQAKIYYSRLKKRNQIRRYVPKYNELVSKVMKSLVAEQQSQ